jgi:TonB-dependent receptor
MNLSGALYALESGTIKGIVTDSIKGNPLPGANVFLDGTSIGSSTDIDGFYNIMEVPPGTYNLSAIYIGYKQFKMQIEIKAGDVITKEIELNPEVIEGETIVVTAQATGQKSAINQQLSAKSIVNVVSSAQIQELPDVNAAESLRRMPGISITRDGGEGNQVVIRGLSPKYNVIKVDGVRMSSSNRDDRGTDLSMISSTMLEGIEVSKTITADQDADVLGGTVNFKLREAKGGDKPGIGFHIMAQGGYTGLSNALNKFRNYKIVPSIEGRFFNEQLGVFAEVNIERRNLFSNSFGGEYDNYGRSNTEYLTNSFTLHSVPRDKKRMNGALALDYKLPFGKVNLTNFLSSSTTELEDREELFDVELGHTAEHVYTLSYSKKKLSLIHNSLNFEGQLPFVHADLKLSHSYSETDEPDDWAVSFRKQGAGIAQFINEPNLDPRNIARAVDTDLSDTNLDEVSTTHNFTRERTLTASLDLELPLYFSKNITSVIKFGGKYRTLKRSYNSEEFGTNATFISPSSTGANNLIIDHFGISTNDPQSIPLSFFADSNYEYGELLGGDFDMHHPMHFEKIKSLVRFCQANFKAFKAATAEEAFARNNYLSTSFNYSGKEFLTAWYVMATINIGSELTIIPGIRFQNLQTTYFGVRGQQSLFSYFVYEHPEDTTVTRNHPFWLPNLNIRYKPLSWFDVRLAYSNTITYPDYQAIIPRINVSDARDLAWNNYKLVPSRSKNYDVYFTFSENRVGLFTIGGFYKQISDLIYGWEFFKRGAEAKPYFLKSKTPSSRITYRINTFVNNSFVTDLWGLEFEWQTHFWYLPDPLKGLVLNINYTRVFSEGKYPFTYDGIDSSFTDRLLDQPNDILNLTVGYDYKDFSVKVSWLHQDDVFTGPHFWPPLRSGTLAYSRWDIAVKQKLPWYGLQVYGNMNNLNNAKDESMLQMYENIPNSLEHYGMTAELGIRWQL